MGYAQHPACSLHMFSVVGAWTQELEEPGGRPRDRLRHGVLSSAAYQHGALTSKGFDTHQGGLWETVPQIFPSGKVSAPKQSCKASTPHPLEMHCCFFISPESVNLVRG